MAAAAPALRINGSTTVHPVVDEAAAALRGERGLVIQVDTLGGSSGGLAALADGRADVAMSSRPLTPGDRQRYPRVDFRAVTIGYDAVALVVSSDVWTAGVRSLSAAQMRAIYERRVGRWSELGGPDRRIAFFNKEPGRGTWEVFARWLYGDPARAPLVSFPEVGANEEARQKVAATRGALSQLSAAWADGQRVHALAIAADDGTLAAPTAAAIAAGAYPMSRPLLLLTDGPPSAAARALIDYVLAAEGQRLVERHGYLPLAAAAATAHTAAAETAGD